MAVSNIALIEGDTTPVAVRIEQPTYRYVLITAILQSAPVRITAALHGLSDGWRAAITNVKGMTQINAQNSPPKEKDFLPVTVIDQNTIEFNSINAVGYKPYTTGGVLQYHIPKDMAGCSVDLTISDRVGGTTLLTLSSQTTGITIDLPNDVTRIVFPPPTYKKAVYSLDIVDALGARTTIRSGAITVTQE